MNNLTFEDIIRDLSGGDLRSLGKAEALIPQIRTSRDFNLLVKALNENDNVIVMRAADIIEKVSLKSSHWLEPHKSEFIRLLKSASQQELKWHLALLMPRLRLGEQELGPVWEILRKWALDKNESRIVRVHSIQGLFEIMKMNPALHHDFHLILELCEQEDIPSINARIRKIRLLT